METDELIQALKMVPETRLRLIALAWKVTLADGQLDPDALAFHAKELSKAMDEAKAYSKATQELVACLAELARS